MKNSVRIEPYDALKYYCFDKKIFYPNEILGVAKSEYGVEKLIGKLVSYKGDVYFISFVNANDISIQIY